MTDLSVLSFFSGAMGLDLGLIEAGLDVRLGQELDVRAVETIQVNGHNVVPGDIRALLEEDPGLAQFMSQAGVSKGEAFAVVGGPPCQPFSTAGQRRGVEDKRGLLIFDYLKAVRDIQPRFMVLENVKGLMSAKGIRSESLLDDVIARIRTMGYTPTWGIVDAAHYGAAQFRERLIIIGSRDGEPVFIPAPTHFQHHQEPDYRWRTLGDAIGDLENRAGESARFSPRVQEILNLVPEGGNWRSLPPDVAEEAMGGAWKSGGGKVGFFRRLSYSEPSPTLVTSPVQKATMLAHPTQARPLSVQEYARIQGFPDDWNLVGTTSDKYKQIGNAVPRALGKAIGKMLKSVAEGSAKIETKRRRGTSTHSRLDH
jgi:DNA (cytosine-5)-methyltransferase 1